MRYILVILVILVFLFASASATTPSFLPLEQRVTPEVTAPNPFSLLGEWLRYVDIEHENLSERIEYIKNNTKKSVESANSELKKRT